jgi:hypothetical protein
VLCGLRSASVEKGEGEKAESPRAPQQQQGTLSAWGTELTGYITTTHCHALPRIRPRIASHYPHPRTTELKGSASFTWCNAQPLPNSSVSFTWYEWHTSVLNSRARGTASTGRRTGTDGGTCRACCTRVEDRGSDGSRTLQLLHRCTRIESRTL